MPALVGMGPMIYTDSSLFSRQVLDEGIIELNHRRARKQEVQGNTVRTGTTVARAVYALGQVIRHWFCMNGGDRKTYFYSFFYNARNISKTIRSALFSFVLFAVFYLFILDNYKKACWALVTALLSNKFGEDFSPSV